MACDHLTSLSLAFPIVAAALLVPDEAAADAAAPGATAGMCPYGDAGYDPAPTGGYPYCGSIEALEDLVPVSADPIPIDGVLVLQAPFQGPWAPTIVDHANVSVTLADVVVPGALEPTDLPGVLVWRPQAAWSAGATYQFSGLISNPDAPVGCAPAEVPLAFDFAIAAEPSDELVPPTLTGEESVITTPIVSLETLACCPDVAPTLLNSNCGGSTLDFDPTQCTPLSASGILTVDVMGTPAATGATAGQVYYSLAADGIPLYKVQSPGQLSPVNMDKPFCATLTAHNLATGESLAGPMACFGADVAEQLGVHPIEPPDSFTCSLRQCEPADNTWDLAACTPLDPNHPNEPEPEKGCGCTTDTPTDAALLALGGLLALAVRRRRR